MRVITGIYKGRRFDIPKTFKARPTTDFAKENIFNVLMGYVDFDGAEALDLFAGTGSISLELLSRGCKEVVSVEKDRDHARFISQCMQKIGAKNDVLVRGDVFKLILQRRTNTTLLCTAGEPCDWTESEERRRMATVQDTFQRRPSQLIMSG